jgi:hypothetical protein
VCVDVAGRPPILISQCSDSKSATDYTSCILEMSVANRVISPRGDVGFKRAASILVCRDSAHRNGPVAGACIVAAVRFSLVLVKNLTEPAARTRNSSSTWDGG